MSGSHSILVFSVPNGGQNSDADLLTGASNTRGMNNRNKTKMVEIAIILNNRNFYHFRFISETILDRAIVTIDVE